MDRLQARQSAGLYFEWAAGIDQFLDVIMQNIQRCSHHITYSTPRMIHDSFQSYMRHLRAQTLDVHNCATEACLGAITWPDKRNLQ